MCHSQVLLEKTTPLRGIREEMMGRGGATGLQPVLTLVLRKCGSKFMSWLKSNSKVFLAFLLLFSLSGRWSTSRGRIIIIINHHL